MISKETLEAVNLGVLDNDQLKEALDHYSKLCDLLKPHGEIYHLVWLDAFHKLNTLESFSRNRKQRT